MEQDPQVWIAALRSGHDSLAEFVAGASADDLARRSMATEWSVAQVLSHLGSGAQIGLAGRTGEAIENEAVWARWNAKRPDDMASSFVEADEALVSWWESQTPEDLAVMEVQLPFLPAPIDAAGAIGFRLSEVAFHGWDVLATFDDGATLAADSAALLVDRLPMMVGFLGQFTPRETRPADDTTIAITTSEPVRDFELELGERADLRRATGAPTTGALDLPAEALLRLTAGRLAAGRENGAVVMGALTLDELRRAFPGY